MMMMMLLMVERTQGSKMARARLQAVVTAKTPSVSNQSYHSHLRGEPQIRWERHWGLQWSSLHPSVIMVGLVSNYYQQPRGTA